jgi:hypothetical protein
MEEGSRAPSLGARAWWLEQSMLCSSLAPAKQALRFKRFFLQKAENI